MGSRNHIPAFQSSLPCKSIISRAVFLRNTLERPISSRLHHKILKSSRAFFGKHADRTNVRQASNQTARRSVTKMIIDPWSVSSETLDVLAGQFFATSLFPYLVFLYYLSRDQVKCPNLANFGFRFLLVFVFATIPAGIYAKLHYHDILANIDWLHGGAESLLTITNLLIVLGFRNAMASTTSSKVEQDDSAEYQLKSYVFPAVLVAATSISSLPILAAAHGEPLNALSFPTWVIHVSSLVEWLVAMGLVWKYASFSDNPRWKGLTWGMLPLHTSGICACTYHLFYNAPSLNILVAVQAALTCFGNATMATAAFRLYQSGKESASGDARKKSDSENKLALVGFEDLGSTLEKDTNAAFLIKVLAISCIGSAIVKWGSLFFDFPFEHSLALALSIIFIPTGLNMMKWAVRSQSESSNFGRFL